MTASVIVSNSVDELSGRMMAAVAATTAINSLRWSTAASTTFELQHSIYDTSNVNNNNRNISTTIATAADSNYAGIGNSNYNYNNEYEGMNSTLYVHMTAAAASSAANASMTTLLQSQDTNQDLVYDEPEQDAINRSFWLLSTAASATMAQDTGTHIVGLGDGRGSEWSQHFNDLVFSWQGVCLIAVFCTFIVTTIVGNTLVILAVITTRRLKTVTNCFVMSLAVADLLVGIFVMPPAVAVHLIGSWQLGWILCDIWISLDVLLCTASILSLCAISVDRYLAVTQPLTYSRKRRSKRLALIMILIVWVLALAITCPPMFGWYEPGRRDLSECRYNQNEGYVIFSAMGSFFIPMAVMIYVYARISCVVAARHDNMTDISVHNKKLKRYTAADVANDVDHDHDLSEQELSSGQKKQAAARTLSSQSIVKDLQDVMSFDDINGGKSGSCSLVALSATPSKNGCYELTCPVTLKSTPTASSTMTTLTNEQHWSLGGSMVTQLQQQQHQAQQPSTKQPHRQSSMRQHQLKNTARTSSGGLLIASPHMDGTSPSSYTTRNTRVHHHHHHHHSKSLSNRITSMKKENKTTQTLSIVVGGFIACWLPFFVYYLITPFLDEHQVSRTLAKALTWLGWFNSAINPFIYAFYSVDFRAAFWRLTCKRFFSTPKPQFPGNTMSIRR